MGLYGPHGDGAGNARGPPYLYQFLGTVTFDLGKRPRLSGGDRDDVPLNLVFDLRAT